MHDIHSVESQLRGDGALGIQLLTLVGPPGTGKTRLAIAAAERLAPSYEHGVYFVDLGAVRETEGAAAAIAHRIGATYRSGRPTALDETLKRWFKTRQVMLVLDNFEGVLQAAELVEDLLVNCPDLRVLATSRAPLRTGREHRFEVAPLASPTMDSSQPAAVLLRFEAVQLFVSRAQALRSDWNLTEANAPAVAEICARLDGLPLAIELAASWMNVLSPQALLKELPHSINRLEGHAGSSGRHQTLDEMIGWSHELLSEAERRLFRRLGVFENGWTIDTALAVCAEPDQSRSDVLSLLGSLVDKHLVVRRESSDGSVRFGFLHTIHDYALGKLEELGQLGDIRRRHAAAVAELCEHAERELNSPLQADWIEVLEQERGNIQAALGWAVATGDVSAVEIGLRIAATLWLFWDVRGHVQEGRQPLRELLQLPEAQTPEHARAKALLSEAWLGYVRGDVTEVESAVANAVAIARSLGDRQIEGRALSILGTTLSSYSDQFERTESVLQEALEISQPFDDTWAIGFSLYSLGTVESRRGRIPEAIAYFEGCQDVSDGKGNAFGVGCAVFRLGILAGTVGDRTHAVALLRQAVQLHWALRNRRVLALCLQQLACVGGGILEATDQARLFAAAQALLDQLPDYLLPEYLLAAQRKGIEATREALGELRFAEAWLEGGRMALESIVHLALGVAENRAVDPGTGRRLSPREEQICGLVMRGLTNREIGIRLGLSHHTVDNHLRRIFDKVGVSSRTALAMWSVRYSGLLTASSSSDL